jgi:uncharacterized ParB-like nuclease family protein
MKPSKATRTTIALSKIRTDGGTQPRSFTDPETIEDYKEAMERGDEFPPIDVFHDGDSYWLADGFHRFIATHERGKKQIEANIHKGTQREAVLFSAGANARHGKPRTRADKRRIIEMIVKDKEWRDATDNWIGEITKTSANTVKRVRTELKLLAGPVRRAMNGKTINVGKLTQGNGPRVRHEKKLAKASGGGLAVIPHASYDAVLREVRQLHQSDLIRLREWLDQRFSTEVRVALP